MKTLKTGLVAAIIATALTSSANAASVAGVVEVAIDGQAKEFDQQSQVYKGKQRTGGIVIKF